MAPLLVKPFLSTQYQSEGDSDYNSNCMKHDSNLTSMSLNTSHYIKDKVYKVINIVENSSLPQDLKNNCSEDVIPGRNSETHIYITYLIVGLYCLAASALFLVIILSDNRGKTAIIVEETEDTSRKPSYKNYSQGQLYLMYFLFFLLILFYGGIEVTYPSQVTTFAVEHLHMSKGDGTLLASMVMGSNAVFTAIGILLVKLVPPNIIIWIDILGLNASLIILTLLVNSHPKIIWLCSFLLGATSASIMPCAYTWANDLFKVTGLFNSAFWCGFFSGFMITPALAGFLMETFDDMWYLYIMLISSILVLILFTLLSIVSLGRSPSASANLSNN